MGKNVQAKDPQTGIYMKARIVSADEANPPPPQEAGVEYVYVHWDGYSKNDRCWVEKILTREPEICHLARSSKELTT